MSARDDYWYVAQVGDMQSARAVQELNAMYDEIDKLRAQRDELLTALGVMTRLVASAGVAR